MKYWQYVIKITFKFIFIGLFLSQFIFHEHCKAQKFSLDEGKKRGSITFKTVKNLIIIPIYINSTGPYNFILDTGVGALIVTDPSLLDTLKLKDLRPTKVYGLGQGKEIEAFLSTRITVEMKGARIERIPTAILKEDIFDLSNYLGVKIYGLVGFHFFDSFVVKVNYTTRRLSYALPNVAFRKRGTKFPIIIENNRPYVFADLQTPTDQAVKVKLILDCGASHALSMSALNGKPFPLPKETIAANLGVGLSGVIEGRIGRVPELILGPYSFKNMLSGFPAFESSAAKIGYNQQDGNLGADLLSRFNITYDYPNSTIYLKPNQKVNAPFDHDMSGIEAYSHPDNLKRMFIGRIEPGSPAEKAGFLEQDEILSINLKSIEEYTLEEIGNLLKSQDGRTLLIEIFRNNKNIIKLLRLKKRI